MVLCNPIPRLPSESSEVVNGLTYFKVALFRTVLAGSAATHTQDDVAHLGYDRELRRILVTGGDDKRERKR